jgi:hypothetical protein
MSFGYVAALVLAGLSMIVFFMMGSFDLAALIMLLAILVRTY